jgi:hypothetical protein
MSRLSERRPEIEVVFTAQVKVRVIVQTRVGNKLYVAEYRKR